MTHFPLFLDLKDRAVCIFGGGVFALQRINKLMSFSAKITVVSPNIMPEIKAIKGITLKEKAFSPEDLEVNPAFVIITESEEITKKIYKECKSRNIPVNAVDMPKFCDIIFPSVISTEHLCVGISSGGISPTATVEFKNRFQELIPENIDEILEWMPLVKQYIKVNIPQQENHNKLLRMSFQRAASDGVQITECNIPSLVEELNADLLQ